MLDVVTLGGPGIVIMHLQSVVSGGCHQRWDAHQEEQRPFSRTEYLEATKPSTMAWLRPGRLQRQQSFPARSIYDTQGAKTVG